MKRHQTVCNLGVHGLMANEGYCVKSDGGCYGWRHNVGLYKNQSSAVIRGVQDTGGCRYRCRKEATGNQKMSLGCLVQDSCHTGCNIDSTGSDSGSTAATAEHTVNQSKKHLELKVCLQVWDTSWSLNPFQSLKGGERKKEKGWTLLLKLWTLWFSFSTVKTLDKTWPPSDRLLLKWIH